MNAKFTNSVHFDIICFQLIRIMYVYTLFISPYMVLYCLEFLLNKGEIQHIKIQQTVDQIYQISKRSSG